MNTIRQIHLHLLRNGAHLTYMRQVLEAAAADPAVSAKAAACIGALRQAVAAEEKAMSQSPKSGLTALIAAADARRGALYRSFRSALGGFARERPGDIQTAAASLQQLVREHGVNPSDPMLVETGMLTNFVRQLETDYRTQVETLGLSLLAGLLKRANDEVNSLTMERTGERKYRVRGATTAARRATDRIYRHFVGLVNGLVYVEGGSAYDAFVSFVNEQILYFRREVLGRKASAPGPDGGAEVPDSPDAGNPGADTGGGPGTELPGAADRPDAETRDSAAGADKSETESRNGNADGTPEAEARSGAVSASYSKAEAPVNAGGSGNPETESRSKDTDGTPEAETYSKDEGGNGGNYGKTRRRLVRPSRNGGPQRRGKRKQSRKRKPRRKRRR